MTTPSLDIEMAALLVHVQRLYALLKDEFEQRTPLGVYFGVTVTVSSASPTRPIDLPGLFSLVIHNTDGTDAIDYRIPKGSPWWISLPAGTSRQFTAQKGVFRSLELRAPSGSADVIITGYY